MSDVWRPSAWAAEISVEMSAAASRYGPIASTHESYGVLAEEMQELLEAIRENDLAQVKREAIQVAAVATRLWLACDEDRFRFRSSK